MVKFLLTADWQMGMEATALGKKAEEVRKARLNTLERIVQIANEKKVDLMIVAGDAFEGNDISRHLLHKVIQSLEPLDDIPVFFLPGNHDYLGPASVYRNYVWEDNKDKFIVMTKRKPIELESCILYPSPLYRPTSPEDPTGWYEKDDIKVPRIGVAHGSLNILPENLDYPIDSERVEKAGLDFLCLGHWHSYLPHGKRTLYPGTPETASFKEKDSGYVAIIDMEKGKEPKVEKIPVRSLSWVTMEREVNSIPEFVALKTMLRERENTKKTLLRLRLEGIIPPVLFDMIDDFKVDLEERYLFSEVDIERMIPDEEDTDILELAPEGPIRETVEELLKEATVNPTARLAIRSFIRITKEVGE